MSENRIRELVDLLEQRLGPDATAAEVERVASVLLSSIESPAYRDVTHAASSTTLADSDFDASRNRYLFPLAVSVAISLTDCTSRLPETVKSKVYDKIRRTATRIRACVVQILLDAEIHVPDFVLQVEHGDQLLSGHSISGATQIMSAVEAAAMDAGFTRTVVHGIRLGPATETNGILDLLPGLCHACPSTEFHLNIGTSGRGLSARDAYSIALVHLLPDVLESSNLVLSCNAVTCSTENSVSPQIDLTLSVWPYLDAMRAGLAPDACFNDRRALLQIAGRHLATEGFRLLNHMIDAITETNDTIQSSIALSLDAPGEGPAPTAIWAGFPIDDGFNTPTSRMAASFLTEALRSEIDERRHVRVTSDSLLCTESLRNYVAIENGMAPTAFAASILDLFADSFRSGRVRSIHFVGTEDVGRESVQLSLCGGLVSCLRPPSGWSESHFLCGGVIIPPAGGPQ